LRTKLPVGWSTHSHPALLVQKLFCTIFE
jgi:hypothetical protein